MVENEDEFETAKRQYYEKSIKEIRQWEEIPQIIDPDTPTNQGYLYFHTTESLKTFNRL